MARGSDSCHQEIKRVLEGIGNMLNSITVVHFQYEIKEALFSRLDILHLLLLGFLEPLRAELSVYFVYLVDP
jgi:hypothetical protein